MNNKAACVVGAILWLAVSAMAEETPSRVVAEFKMVDGLPVVPVKLDGKECPFVILPANSFVVLDNSLRKTATQPIRQVPSRGTGELFDAFEAPDATIGNIRLKECGEVIYADLTPYHSVTGVDVRGILGKNLLEKYVVQMDVGNGVLRFIDPLAHSDTSWGAPVALEGEETLREWETVRVRGSVSGIKALFAFSPFGPSELGRNTYAAACRMQDEHLREGKTLTIITDDAQDVDETRVARFDVILGDKKYQGLIFMRSDQCTLGRDFLRRHSLVTFDFPDKKLYLKEGRNFDRQDEADMSGLHLLRIDGKTIVARAADKETPASKAGIKLGDVIVKIDGKDAGEYTLFGIRDLLRSSDGKKINLTIRRGEEVLDVVITLQELW